MRHLFLASTCLFALAASPAAAETKIETATTAPVRTSTIKTGTPDDILITSAGSISTTSPVAVAIDSNNKVTNQGSITIGSVNGATGIQANAGVSGGITNTGKITVDEAYTPTDSDNDGDLDGPFAVGSNRFGIHTLGAFTGNIVNSGTILVEGNDSAGILLGGPLTGNFVHDGTTTVLGNNALGVGLSDVSGNVRLAGTITATGLGAVAVRSSGDIAGAMVLQGKIVATGYRYTTPPTDRSKLDADDLLQGGPAVSIEGNVAGGIILAIAPKDQSSTDKDEDDDGIEDAKEGSAAIASYGAAPALRIGHVSDAIAVGPVAGSGTNFGLIIDGGVLGDGLYAGVDGNAVQIGGLGGAVSIANGIGISGVVQAKSLDRAATAIRLGSGATTAELRNSGKVLAGSGNTATSTATAIRIDGGASLPVLRNSGEINASVGGADGTAVAIVDHSGTLGLIENSGAIIAQGAAATSSRNVAIDLAANTSGAIIRQTAVAATFAAPSMVGDIRFGSGGDLLDVADGKQVGNVTFGLGDNRYNLSGDAVAQGNLGFGSGADTVALSGTSTLTGNVDFGGGADVLTIGGTSAFSGQLSNTAGLSVAVAGGSVNVAKGATISSLNVTGGGTIGVMLDKTPGASSSLIVSGTATFDTGSKLRLSVANVAQAEGTFTVLSAGSLVGGSDVSSATDLLPFLYKGTIGVSGNQIDVTVARKSASELGLNASESAAYSAIYTALGKDVAIGNSFLAIREGETFRSTLQQMLPEHAGGSFEAVTAGDRAIARMLADPTAPYKEQGDIRYWVDQVAWGSSKAIGSTAGFKVGGWGVNGGAEVHTPIGAVGASVSYLWGNDKDRATPNGVDAQQYGVAAHWRLQKGGFQAVARAGWTHIGYDGTRNFASDASGTLVQRTMESEWNGRLVSASGHISQQLWAGSFYARPGVSIEYYRLREGAHQESGGGDALDLTVAARTSDELALNGLLTLGAEFGARRADEDYLALEVEGGRRQILSGSLGKTVASFGDGTPVTLEPEERQNGWLGRLRALYGSPSFRLSGEVGAEEREERVGISGRLGLNFGF
jgi:hypothetical protein